MANILSYIRNKHFLSFFTNGITAVLSLISIGLIFRFLTPEEAGIWIFFQTAFVLIDTFRTGFLQTAFIKFYGGTQPQRASEVAGSTWYLALLITAAVFVANVIAWFIPVADKSIANVVTWFSITFIATLPMVVATWILQAQQKFGSLLAVRLVNQGSFIVIVLAYIVFDELNMFSIMFANLLSCIIPGIYVMLKRWTLIHTITHKSRNCVTELYHFGKYSVGTTISANLLRSSDTFIINFMLGPAYVAIYNIGQKLMEFIEIPLRSFLATGLPALSTAYNQGSKTDVAGVMKKYAGLVAVALIPVAIFAVAFADVAVRIIGGPQFADTEAAGVFRIFMSFAIFLPIDRFIGVTLDVIHLPKINFIKVVLMLLINVVGDVIGIQIFQNVYGVAIASVPTFIIGTWYGLHYLKKHLPVSMKDIFSVGFSQSKYYLQKLGIRKNG